MKKIETQQPLQRNVRFVDRDPQLAGNPSCVGAKFLSVRESEKGKVGPDYVAMLDKDAHLPGAEAKTLPE